MQSWQLEYERTSCPMLCGHMAMGLADSFRNAQPPRPKR